MNNTGGWQLTVGDRARGGRTPDRQRRRHVRVDDRQRTRRRGALQFLHDLKWVDGSFGSKVDLDWGTINQEFAAGNIGMYTHGVRRLHGARARLLA